MEAKRTYDSRTRFPPFTMLRNAMNSRNAIPSPTATIRVVPVAAGCCSALARAIVFPPRKFADSGDRDDVRLGRDLRFHLRCNLFRQFAEPLFKGVAAAIRCSPDPEGRLAA